MLPGSLHVGLPAGSLHVGQHLSVKDAALPWLQNGALAKMDILKCQGPRAQDKQGKGQRVLTL